MTHAVKLSEAESAAGDVARGGISWSEWLRALVLAAVGPGQSGPAAVPVAVNRNEPVNLNAEPVNLNGDGKPVNRDVAVNQNEAPRRARARKPAPAVPPALADAGLTVASALPKPRRCSHPGKRTVGGYCDDCDHLILAGGVWA